MKGVAKAYLVESKWREERYIAPLEEYMKNGHFSSTYPMLITNSYVGMGDVASKEAFDWISNDPKMLVACTTICRVMDDIVTHQVCVYIYVCLCVCIWVYLPMFSRIRIETLKVN